MERLNEFWEKLTPNQKRYVSWGAAGFVVISLSYAFVAGTTPQTVQLNQGAEQEDKDVTPLVSRDIKGLSIERVKGEMERLQAQQRKQNAEIERLRRELAAAKARQNTNAPHLDQEKIRQMIADELARVKAVQQVAPTASGTPAKSEPGDAGESGGMTAPDDGASPDLARAPEENPFARVPPYTPPATTVPGQPQPAGAANAPAGQPATASRQDIAIRTIEPESVDAPIEEAAAVPYVPMGSMITGVFLTGMDAGTGKNAQKNPYPALIRVKKDAILPNRYRQDVRECFILASGYGDLSSERVHLRAEGISCIRPDGKPIEVHARMIAVGEDGKEGLRGRVVSKQGQLLAKSLMAGVLSGFASAFNQNAVPTINLNPTGTTPFQQAFSKQALQSGLVKGTSSALDRLAQFYLDAADQMFPVIEIDAMRRVTFVVEKGFAMQPTGGTDTAVQPAQEAAAK